MTISPTAIRHTASSAVPLHIRIAQTPADWQLAHSLLEEEHLLGAGREAGDRLCQFVLEEDRIVAVLIWCAAAWHIQDRDTMIGWDPVTRSQRLKLVVQLRRFLVPEKNRRPNLASQSLGLALRELPEDSKAGLTHGGGTRSPIKVAQLKTLRDAFALVPDPRRAQSRRHPLSAMLTLIALGLLMGGRDMLNI
jgi:hypothetical protein